jgi:hypothetical protein
MTKRSIYTTWNDTPIEVHGHWDGEDFYLENIYLLDTTNHVQLADITDLLDGLRTATRTVFSILEAEAQSILWDEEE